MPERGFRRVRLIAALTFAGVTGLAGGALPSVVADDDAPVIDDGHGDTVPRLAARRRPGRDRRRRRGVPDDRDDGRDASAHDGRDASADHRRDAAADHR